jgi:hypothetical protein
MNEFANKTNYGYRKKPVMIEAVQYKNAESLQELNDWVKSHNDAWEDKFSTFSVSDRLQLVINTLEGPMNASEGDFIIRGLKGEYYACKPDIFKMTYEKA